MKDLITDLTEEVIKNPPKTQDEFLNSNEVKLVYYALK